MSYYKLHAAMHAAWIHSDEPGLNSWMEQSARRSPQDKDKNKDRGQVFNVRAGLRTCCAG